MRDGQFMNLLQKILRLRTTKTNNMKVKVTKSEHPSAVKLHVESERENRRLCKGGCGKPIVRVWEYCAICTIHLGT